MNSIKENKRIKTIKSLFILSLSLLLIGCISLEKRIEKNRIDFYVGINSCFEKDSLIIKINNIEIFNAINVTSNINSGSTGIYFEYYENSKREGILVINNHHQKQKRAIFFNFKEKLTLNIIRNGYSKEFYLDLKKGKRILINVCNNEIKTTSIRYYKKRIIVD